MNFVPFARVKFNREYAPADFPYDLMGEPDVVLMGRVEHPQEMAEYSAIKNAVPLFTDWDEAVAHRDKRMEPLGSPIQLQGSSAPDTIKSPTTKKYGRISEEVFRRNAKSLGLHFEDAYLNLVAIHQASQGGEGATRGNESADKIARQETAVLRRWAEKRGLMFDSGDFSRKWEWQRHIQGQEHHLQNKQSAV